MGTINSMGRVKIEKLSKIGYLKTPHPYTLRKICILRNDVLAQKIFLDKYLVIDYH